MATMMNRTMMRPSASASASSSSTTQYVYGLIADQRYGDAIRALHHQLQAHPGSRAALSLLAYCYYYIQDFVSASEHYEQLVTLCPHVSEYSVHWAQSLFNAGMHDEAHKVASTVTDPQYAQRMIQLQAAIRYAQDDIAGTKTFISLLPSDTAETLVATSAVQYKEGNYDAARQGFTTAAGLLGQQPDLLYNIALCHYKQGSWALALKGCGDIIERGVREHPELSVGSALEDGDVRSVGNSQALRETCLLEAFNLKAAVELTLNNTEAAREALREMPPRLEEELDHVTLHNTALANMATDPSGGFRKLQHLLRNPPRPPETLANLVLLYIKHRVTDLAADVLADYASDSAAADGGGLSAGGVLSQDMFEYLSALVEGDGSEQAQAEAYRSLDQLATRHVDVLRKRTKAIQDARLARSDELIKAAVAAYDAALDQYIPVLMGQARIYWDRGNYSMAERVFRQSAEFCSDHETWKLNVAHVFFMQSDKYHDAIRYYEPFVRRHLEGGETDILNVTAIVLANLCVAYIMTSQNDVAAELMRQIDRAEERHAALNNGAQSYHLCIVNIVIGTLYCSKGNFEFGIERVMKALEPQSKKLSAETWFHSKRCFLALAETVAKQMLVMKDSFFADVINFLTACEAAGGAICAALGGSDDAEGAASGSGSAGSSSSYNASAVGAEAALAGRAERALAGTVSKAQRTVAYEARMLKRMFIRLRDN